MKKTVLAVMLALMSPLSQAGSQVGTVVFVNVRASDGLVHVVLSGAKNFSPACATRGYWMIRDENSNAGKQQYALLLAAKLSAKTVVIRGGNTCLRWGDGEDIDEVEIID